MIPTAKAKGVAPADAALTIRLDQWHVVSVADDVESAGISAPDGRDVVVPSPAAPLSWAGWDEASWECLWHWQTDVEVAHAHTVAELEIGAVTGSIVVRVNGVEIGSAESGFLPCVFDVARAIRPGQNTIEIIEDARWRQVPPMGSPLGASDVDFFLPAGINRPVHLRLGQVQKLHGVDVRSYELLGGSPTVTVTTSVPPSIGACAQATVTARIVLDDRVVAEADADIAQGQTEITLALHPGPDLALWSPESPVLHEVEVVIASEGVTQAAASVRTGFREVSWDSDGLRINGERRRLLGLNRHELFPFVGFAASERAQRNDARILKEDLGIDIVRCAHYPQSEAFLDACDELGLLVFEEAPGWQYAGTAQRDAVYADPWQPVPLDDRDPEFERQHLDQLRRMIERDRHRPSIVVWGVFFNETRAFTPDLWETAIEQTRGLDPHRPLSGATRYRRGGHEGDAFDSAHDDAGNKVWPFDVFGYNDYSVSEDDQPLFLDPVEGYPYLLTEVIGQFPRFTRGFSWDGGVDALARQVMYHAAAIEQAFAPGVSGVIAWSAFDYQSPHGSLWGSNEPGLGPRGHALKTPGVADAFRITRPAASVYRAQALPQERIVLEPAFIWEKTRPESAGGEIAFASNCDELIVAVDDGPETALHPSHDRFPRTPHPLFVMPMPQSGAVELRVRGLIGGQAVATLQMTRDTSRDRFTVGVDDAAISGDGVDSTRVWFHVADAYGNMRTSVSGAIRISVTGPGQLIGPDVLDVPSSVGAVWVRALPGSTGTISLNLVHPTAGARVVNIDVFHIPTPLESR